ncbi:MAG: RICIN domain-containing protein [Saccharofermentans sp.]|nr:RICIN domain-containing protein [Saccharofermentans sp.]
MRNIKQKIISFICIISLAFSIVALPQSSKPVSAASNPYSGGETNCTYVAWRECYNATGHALPGWGDAGTWFNSAKNAGYSTGSTPKANSIVVWSGSPGHVAWVSAVNGNSIYIKEGGYRPSENAPKQYHEGWLDSYQTINKGKYSLLGFIYINHEHSYTTPYEITKKPTASSTGILSFKCTNCNYVTTVTIPAIKDSNIREGTYKIAAKSNNSMYLSVRPGQESSGGDVALYGKGKANQQFKFVHNSDSTYTIYYGSLCLDVAGAAFQGNLQLYTANGTDAQKWYVVSLGSGYYRLVNKATYYNIDIVNNGMSDGTDVCTYWNTDLPQQCFKLELVECTSHSWDSGKVTKQPGVGTTGTKEYTCTACGKKKTEMIPALISMSDVSVSVSNATYTGSELKPAVKVTYNSKTLVNGTDYTVTFSNNVNIGKATVIVTGKGNYSGTKTVYFSIIGPSYTWKKSSGHWYLYDNNGTMVTGWKQLNGVWYYLGSNGAMRTGWQQISGKWYYFEGSGAMVTGWLLIIDKWYYLDNSGTMLTGWQQIGGVWYYFESSGAMATGWKQIGGKWYYLKSDGSMASNEYCGGYWLNADGSWTYQYKASWNQNSKGWWYGDSTGWYAKNTQIKIDGTVYRFDSNGYWIK